MKLYHVTPILTHDGIFIPRIPKGRLDKENSTIKRVCLSSSIEGCLSAMPDGGDMLNELLKTTNGILRVFEVEISEAKLEEKVYIPQELTDNGYVLDAVYTGEYWYTDSFKATESFLIQLSDWKDQRRLISSGSGESLEQGYIHLIDNIVYTRSDDAVASVNVPYPGDDEWKIFLSLGRMIGGKGLRKRKDNIYRTEKCGEEFFYLAANFGTNGMTPFKVQLGQSAFPQYNDMEVYKEWDGMIIYRESSY